MRSVLLSLALAAATLACLPDKALALCEGTDLMADLTQAEAAELATRVAATPYPSGLLWRAQKGDTGITIFGTYHFRHDLTAAHLAALTPLIDHAGIVYLETGGDDMDQAKRAMASEPELMFITQGPTLIDQLGPEDWQTYSEAMADRAIPGFMAAKFKPFFGSMLLSLGPCVIRSGLMDQPGIDVLINNHAAEKAQSLEDWRTMLGMIDNMPQDEQIEMLRASFAYIDQADDLTHTLLQRYLDQDIARLWEYMKMESLKAGFTAEEFAIMEKPLLQDRNRAWSQKLVAEIGGKEAFVAVGAGHLPGEAGLLNLLAEQGFEVKRLPFATR